MSPTDISYTTYYWSTIVTMAVSCTVFELKQDIGRKTPIFHTPFHLICMFVQNPFDFFPKFLTQTVRVHKLLDSAKLLPKSSTLLNRLHEGHGQTTDRRISS